MKSKPKTSLKRLPWQPVATQESRPPLQAKLRNYSTSILRQYFASVQGTPVPERENGQLQDSDLFLTDVILSVSEVATGPD